MHPKQSTTKQSINNIPLIRNGVTKLAVGTLLALSAGSVLAADLYGGGATFPAQAYVGNDFLRYTPNRRLSRNVTAPAATSATLTPPNSVFARFVSNGANRISYCQSGSGTGKSLLTGVGSVVDARGACGDYSGSPAGFTARTVAPDYIGTDSPINQQDANNFTGGPRAARSGIFQIPTIAGSIALARSKNLNYPNLTTEQVCRIYSARVTNWSQIPNSGSTAPIRVAYRDDDSGTSFAFTSYLATACNGKFGVPAGYFKPNQSFKAAVPAVPGQPGSRAPLYAASAAASGNAGLVTKVKTTPNATAYADYAEVAAQSVEFPTVNNVGPANPSLSGAVNIPAPLSGRVLNANNAPVAVTGIANQNCLRLVNPRTVPTGVTYPILAYTYINGYVGGNAAKAAALRGLVGTFLAGSNRGKLPPGYAYLDGNTTYRNSIRSTINTCIK